MVKRLMLAALTAALLVSGCASSNLKPQCSDEIAAEQDPKLLKGDVLSVVIFRQENMSGEFTIDSEGILSIPLLGRIKAAGHSTKQMVQIISDRLVADGYLVKPSVTVALVTGGQVYAIGEVNAPSKIPYLRGMTVIEAITEAGGFTYRADRDHITITRGECSLTAAFDTPLLPRDVIEVHERFF